MKRLFLILTPALAASVLAGPAAAQSAIKPGYWETTNKVTSPFPTSKTERRCIKPSDVAKFMDGPSNHIYTCTYPTRIVGDGKIKLAGSCKSKNSKPVPISGEGVFTRDTFHMDARIQARVGGLTIPVRASTDAKRIGDDCPAEAAAAN